MECIRSEDVTYMTRGSMAYVSGENTGGGLIVTCQMFAVTWTHLPPQWGRDSIK